MYFTITNPKYLFLLLIIPLIILVHLLALKSTKKRALRFANFEAISRINGVEFFSKNIVTTAVSILIIICLVLAASELILHKQAKASSFSFVLALDTSRSMRAQDILPNRLEAAKQIALDFIDTAPSSIRIGIVSFSGNSYIEKDITDDKDQMKEAVSSIELSSIEGTDLYEAVLTSTNLLKKEDGKAILLLSDGQINVGTIDEAITYANDNDVIINTIAIGTVEGGATSYGISRLDEDSLKALAYNTGGEFFGAVDRETLSESFNKAMKLTSKNVSIELWKYLIFIAMFLFVVEYILESSRYKGLP